MAATPNSTRPKSTRRKVAEFARWVWTQLTSMKTALGLLFLLALAAIPGSIFPQRDISPIRVSDFKKANPIADKFLEPLGFYNVYSSPWFSAIYLLLFISLMGCIIPRMTTYARQLRSEPPRMPSRLDRLPHHLSTDVPDAASATAVLDDAEAWLRKRRYRIRREEAGIRAEKGYLREFGNLLFHISLVILLVGVAWNSLLGYKGTAVVVEGQGFTNNITQYDDFAAGTWVDTDALPAFGVHLDDFRVAFETGPVQTGAARLFEADVQVTDRQGTHPDTIEVNEPLTIDGQLVHILGHGYAPRVTITDANGDVAYSGPTIFLPQDVNYRSNGVIKAPDARPQRIALEGMFLPTAVIGPDGPQSAFPDAFNPEVVLTGYYGPPQEETGRPENIYALNIVGMTQLKTGDEPWKAELRPGESADLPDGVGKVTFEGYQRWVKLQISRSPGLPLSGVAVGLAIVGLCLSLFVRPRRLWIKRVEREDGVRLQIAGLDRIDGRTGLDDELAALSAAIVPDQEAQQ